MFAVTMLLSQWVAGSVAVSGDRDARGAAPHRDARPPDQAPDPVEDLAVDSAASQFEAMDTADHEETVGVE